MRNYFITDKHTLPVAPVIRMFIVFDTVLLKGVMFGILAFVIAQVGFMVMGMMFPEMPELTGNMVMIVMGSVLGHILFGIVAVWIIHRK